MKVLILHHQMGLYGGAELVVVYLARYLMRRGHTVKILAGSSKPHEEYYDLDIETPLKEVQWHLWDGAWDSLKEIYGVYSGLKKLCSEYAGEFDVINPHNFPAIWAAPKNKRVVWMCNEVPDLWHRQKPSFKLERLLDLGRLADRTIARSKHPRAVVADEGVSKLFQQRYGFQPHIVPYGIEGKFFAQRPVGVSPRGHYRVLHPAVVSPSKNQAAVVVAAASLKSTIPDIEVIFSGYRETESNYAKYLNALACAYKVDKHITYIGPTSRGALRYLYHSCHVAVFPGRGQGSWLGPFEQLAVGNPIVVSPSLSCSKLIQDNNLGIVTDNFRDAIYEVYSNYTKYQQQAQRGQKFVLDNLTWDSFGAKMEEVMSYEA